MSEKKARASVFFVIAIIAFICSCILFSMTGGVSDWIGDTVYDNDTENSTDLGISEFMEQYDVPFIKIPSAMVAIAIPVAASFCGCILSDSFPLIWFIISGYAFIASQI